MKIKLEGYMPDLDRTTPGIIVQCSAFLPSIRGYVGAPSPVTGSVSSALAAACRGAYSAIKLDSSVRIFAGTGTKLYEASGSGWTDRTRAVGGNYALGAVQRWRFAQFGDTTIACGSTTAGDVLQASTTGAFADIAGSPRAEIVETVGRFVFVFSTIDGTYGTRPDAWWCSAINDHTLWTPSISTQSATGRLVSAPGAIKAAKRFGDAIVVYKEGAMYLGVYVGPPEIWRFQELPGRVGALTNEAVVNIGTDAMPRHFIMGFDDFYVFDGSRTEPVGLPVRETVFGSINRASAYAAQIIHDPSNARIYCYYPISENTNPDNCVVYNYRTGKWGRDDRTIEAGFEYYQPSLTYGDLGTYYSTYADFPNAPYGSFAISSSIARPGVFNSSHVLQSLIGEAGSSTWETGDVGDDRAWTMISSVKPRYLTAPLSGNMTNRYRANIGSNLVTDQTVSISDEAKFDVMREARWHSFAFAHSGDYEVSIVDVDAVPSGAY